MSILREDRDYHNELWFLKKSFLDAMNDIGSYGHEKYGTESFNARALNGDRSRGKLTRASTDAILSHAVEHFLAYRRGELHDHFGTQKHQLAAVAFNAMMEYYFAGLEDEKSLQDDTERAKVNL